MHDHRDAIVFFFVHLLRTWSTLPVYYSTDNNIAVRPEAVKRQTCGVKIFFPR